MILTTIVDDHCCKTVLQRMAGVAKESGESVTDIVEETLSSSTSRFSNLVALHVAPRRAVFAAYDRLLDNRTVVVKCRVCSRDNSDRFYFLIYIHRTCSLLKFYCMHYCIS